MSHQNNNVDEKAYSQVTDFLIGFLAIPFSFFLGLTSVRLLFNPQSITDGMGLIYIALLTGTYYTLDKQTLFYLSNSKEKRPYFILGFICFSVFVFLYCFGRNPVAGLFK